MKYWSILCMVIFWFYGCKKNESIVTNSTNFAYDYTVDQVTLSVVPFQHNGDSVRVYSKADTVKDVRLLSDNSQVDRSMWRYYRTIKGLFTELTKWDTTSFIIIDTMNMQYNYPRYISIQPKPGLTGVGYIFKTSNYSQNK